MDTEILELNIEIGLHEHCMQGRDGYKSGIRPNHWIPGRDYTFPGQVDFKDREILKPGDKCEATLNCIINPNDKDLFKHDFAWHICEGNKIVGYIKVL